MIKEQSSLLPATNFTSSITVVFYNEAGQSIGEINTNLNNSTGRTATLGYASDGTFTKIVNGIGSFKVRAVDSTWFNVENAILNSKGNCTVQYGYLEPEASRSPIYKARIFNYSLEYDLGRVIVTMSGLLMGFEIATLKNWTIGKENKQFPEILTNIMDVCNLDKGLIEDSVTPVDFNKVFSSEKGPIRVGNASGETPIQVILQKIAPYATNKEGTGGFLTFVSYKNPDGKLLDKPVLNFCTAEYKETNTQTNRAKVYRLFDTIPDKRVIDYTPSWNATLIDIAGGAGVTNSAFNTIAGDIVKAGDENKTKKDLAVNASVPGPESAAKASVAVSRANALLCPLTAELTILGDPEYEVLDQVIVLVRPPENSSAAKTGGMYHKMSGTFMASQVVDTISMGKYQTKLNLMISPKMYRSSQEFGFTDLPPLISGGPDFKDFLFVPDRYNYTKR